MEHSENSEIKTWRINLETAHLFRKTLSQTFNHKSSDILSFSPYPQRIPLHTYIFMYIPRSHNTNTTYLHILQTNIKFLFLQDHGDMINRRWSHLRKLLRINMQQIKPIFRSHLYMFRFTLTYEDISIIWGRKIRSFLNLWVVVKHKKGEKREAFTTYHFCISHYSWFLLYSSICAYIYECIFMPT